MVCSEAAPFAHTGGLADVMAGLPKALVAAGEQVAVVLPRYASAVTPDATLVYERLPFALGASGYMAQVFESIESGVRYLFVDIPGLYDRQGLYGDDADSEYPDNHLRFGALCRAALGVARHMFTPDIMHAHDWQAAFVPIFLKDTYRYHPAYLGIKSVFTIHNLGYQGVFPKSALDDLGLPARLGRPDALEYWGNICFLKGALVFADFLTTVSPNYAQEIQTPEFGFGLDGVLRARRDALSGILNGVDYSTSDPAISPHLPMHFDREHLEGKRECKRAALREAGLSENRLELPLVGIVSRFAEQKGFDLLMQVPHEIVAENVSLIAFGSGEQRYEDFFRWYASAYPDQVAFTVGYDEGLAHRIEAGSDMFLMPSRYEPCGLHQIYSLRYGTLPIVRATGGLEDTVDYEAGFKFRGDTPGDLLACIREALQVWATPGWREMMDAAMQKDFSWDFSAREYIRLYRRLLS